MEAHQAKLSFFKAATCQQMLERLIGHYLPLTAEELQTWEESAEEFGGWSKSCVLITILRQ